VDQDIHYVNTADDGGYVLAYEAHRQETIRGINYLNDPKRIGRCFCSRILDIVQDLRSLRILDGTYE
jgi:hypothetical protein